MKIITIVSQSGLKVHKIDWLRIEKFHSGIPLRNNKKVCPTKSPAKFLLGCCGQKKIPVIFLSLSLASLPYQTTLRFYIWLWEFSLWKNRQHACPLTDVKGYVWRIGELYTHNLTGWQSHRCLKSWILLNFLIQAMEPKERTDPKCIWRSPHANSMRSVNGCVQCERGLTECGAGLAPWMPIRLVLFFFLSLCGMKV